MQEYLDNNDIIMYSTHNEGKSVIAEKFIKTLKTKMTINNSKSYLSYMNKLLYQYNNTYHHSVNKKIILLWLKTLRPIWKPLSLKLMIESELLPSIWIYFVKFALKNGPDLLSILSWKLILEVRY